MLRRGVLSLQTSARPCYPSALMHGCEPGFNTPSDAQRARRCKGSAGNWGRAKGRDAARVSMARVHVGRESIARAKYSPVARDGVAALSGVGYRLPG
jgi:hypothetical protein